MAENSGNSRQEMPQTPPRRRQGFGGPGGPPPGMMPGEKPKNFKGTIKTLFRYLGEHRITVFIVMILALGGTAFSIAGPRIMSLGVTELFNGLQGKLAGTGGIDFRRVGTILLILLGVYVTSAFFTFIQGWTMTAVTQKICFRMRQEISE
jgi:ATP-binding cassette subfamily B protein